MQTYFCISLTHIWVIGLIILLGVLVFLVVLALASLPSSPNPDATRAEIRSVGTQARDEIKRTAGSYQRQAQEILTRKR